MIAVGIVHAAHKEDRKAPYDRLRVQLAGTGWPIYVADKPAKGFWEWADDVWAGTGALAKAPEDRLLFLNDDVILVENFQEIFERAVRRMSCPVVLHLPHWSFEGFSAGWVRSMDGFVGPAYSLTRADLREFLHFKQNCFRPVVHHEWPEDAQLAVWCLATRRKIWHAVPALVDIDTTVKSSYGHDGDVYTRPWVRPVQGQTWDFDPPYDDLPGLCYRNYHWAMRWCLTPAAQKEYRVVEYAYHLEREALQERYKAPALTLI